MSIKELWNKYFGKEAPAVEAVRKSVDELADDMRAEATALFQRAHDAQERAAETLEDAAHTAQAEAEQARQMAASKAAALKASADRILEEAKAQGDELRSLAEARLEKAKNARGVAEKLKSFLE